MITHDLRDGGLLADERNVLCSNAAGHARSLSGRAIPEDVRVEKTITDVQGPPAAMGLAHGRTLAPRIQHSLAEWRKAMR